MKREEAFGLFDVTGKVALVTGATGSLGHIAAFTLGAAGAKVMLTGRNQETLDEYAKKIVADGGAADWMPGDPASHDDVTRVVKGTVEKFGGIDILVVAHGKSIGMVPITEQDDETWRSVMGCNYDGTYFFCKEAVQVMAAQGRGGKIILVGSVRGELGYPKYTAYCSSKGAVHLLGKTLAWETGAYGVNVNIIAPGVFRAPLTAWLYADPESPAYKGILTRMPIGRLGEPEDFSGAVLFLASRASDWVHGHVLCVDGGYSSG